MVAYNFGMVALNGFIVAELIRFAWLSGYSFRCAGVPPGDSVPVQRVVRAAFLFWATKIIEFSDTFMFVARKKYSQITFLHVFHHFAVPLSTWFGVKVVPGQSYKISPSRFDESVGECESVQVIEALAVESGGRRGVEESRI